METRWPKEVGPSGQIPWPRGTPYPGPRASDVVDLHPRAFVLTKNDYKNSPPDGFRKGAPQKHKTTKQKTWSCRLEGENSGGALPGWSPSSPTSPPSSPWWRGSSPPPGLWVCGGNLIQSLYVWSLLKSIWCALHKYGSIYVIPMVDIVVWDDTCYAFTVVLDLLWLVILWRYSMMHVMVRFMHNALFIHVMRWLTPPSVDRWERCGHAHEIWIIALVFRILSIMKYDVCG